MSVAVIIPTYGRTDLLVKLVAQLHQQTVPPNRILLVDDTPGDDVQELAQEIGVDYLRNEGRPSLTRARNAGIEATSEPIIAFLDSDVVLPQDYLERMVALFADPREPTAVQGYVPNDWNHAGWKRVPLWLLGQGINAGTSMRFKFPFKNTFPHKPTGISESEWLSGANMVFHRERLGDIRFDPVLERYCLAEDVDMGLQLAAAGKIMLLDADTIVHELNDAGGRIQNKDLELMRIINIRYLLAKHFPTRRLSTRLTYQDIGWMLQTEGLRFPKALARYVRNRKLAKRAKSPDEWNKLYGFWQ